MKNKTDYEFLHVSELEEKLRKIDQEQNPEEAEYIRALINKGGYKYPVGTNFDGTEITNKYFKWALLGLLVFLAVINTIVFAVHLRLISLIPVLFQSVVIFMIMRKHKYLRIVVRIWFMFTILINLLGVIVFNLSPDSISDDKLIFILINLSFGVIFFWLSGRYIILREKISGN